MVAQTALCWRIPALSAGLLVTSMVVLAVLVVSDQRPLALVFTLATTATLLKAMSLFLRPRVERPLAQVWEQLARTACSDAWRCGDSAETGGRAL